MTYAKQTWHNKPATDTPFNATRGGHMEDGIYDASVRLDAVEPRLDDLEAGADGAVVSVNGHTDVVVLTAADVGAATVGALSAHLGAPDPHPQYLTQAEGDGLYQGVDPDLSTFGGLDSSIAGMPATDGGGWIRKSYAQVRAALGLATVATTGNYNDLTGKPTIGGLDAEGAQDAAAALIAAGTQVGLTATYDDAGNALSFTVLDQLPEFSAAPQTAAVGSPSTMLRRITRFSTAGAPISQPAPPAVPGAQFAIGWDLGANALTLVGASRSDTCGTTSGSATISDASILATDLGRVVTGAGIPANSYVGTVTPGASFLLSSSPTSQVNVNATATGASVSATVSDRFGPGTVTSFAVPFLGEAMIWHCTTQGQWRETSNAIPSSAIPLSSANTDLSGAAVGGVPTVDVVSPLHLTIAPPAAPPPSVLISRYSITTDPANSYNYPPRVRQPENQRRRLVIRNDSAADTYTIAYSTGNTGNFNNPGGSNFIYTIGPGQEFVDVGNGLSLFVRTAADGTALVASVYVETQVA